MLGQGGSSRLPLSCSYGGFRGGGLCCKWGGGQYVLSVDQLNAFTAIQFWGRICVRCKETKVKNASCHI